MELKLQIYSLLFSFAFGIFFNLIMLIVNKLKKSLKNSKITNLFLICIIVINSLVYFLILKTINEGIVHIYFIIMIIIGYFVSQKIVNKHVRTLQPKNIWYNIFKIKR